MSGVCCSRRSPTSGLNRGEPYRIIEILAFVPDSAPTAAPSLLEQELLALYREHASGLSRYAASFARNPDHARDAVQEIFLRYFIERRFGREIGNPRAWLYFVLRNYLLRQQRAIAGREVLAANLDELAVSRQSIDEALLGSETRRDIAAALTRRELECVLLRAEGMEYTQIAAVLGVQTGTVGALLSRAQKKIRRAKDACSRHTAAACR